MSASIEVAKKRIADGLLRLAKLNAMVMIKEKKEVDRVRQRERKLRVKRRAVYGDAVLDAGLDHWEQDEIVGLLLHALDDIGTSPTARLALRKRGEAKRVGQAIEPLPSE